MEQYFNFDFFFFKCLQTLKVKKFSFRITGTNYYQIIKYNIMSINKEHCGQKYSS